MLNLIHAVAGRPWAIRAEIALQIRGLVANGGLAALRHLAELKSAIHAFDESDGRPRAGRGDSYGPSSTVAVVRAIGTLTQRVEEIGSAETRSVAAIAAEVRAAVMAPNVDAVVLEVDSPGGEVFGVPEAWASIRESGRMKPVVAHANSVAASAALYLASAANEVWVTPSGQVGSVGVYALHVDSSKAIESKGETWDFIVSDQSPFKIEGNPAAPLTDEARAYMQREVNRYMAMFVRDLAAGRGVSEKAVLADFGGGRMLSPSEAVKVRMVDKVGTFEHAVRRAAEMGQGRPGGAAARSEVRQTEPAAACDPVEIAALSALAGLPTEKE